MSLFDKNEYAADQAIAEMQYEAYLNMIHKGLWKCKDGTYMSVEDMTTEHINNCIKMLKDKPYSMRWVDRFKEELARRERFKCDLKRALEELREEPDEIDMSMDDWSGQ